MGERNLLVDIYSGDLGGKPNWQAVVDAPNFVGAIIKATESISFNTNWFNINWRAVKDIGGERYGSKWQSIALRKGGEKFKALGAEVAASVVRENSFVAHRHN